MTKLQILAVSTLVLGPAVVSAAPTAKSKPKATATKPMLSPKAQAAIKGGLQPKSLVGSSLSKVQLGSKIKDSGLAKPVGGEFEVRDVKVVSPTRMRLDDGTHMQLLCPTFVTGFAPDFPASYQRTKIADCPVAGAEIMFPVQAGRVYVVECQTNNIPWRMTRLNSQTPTSDVATTGSTSNPTYVMLAQQNGWAGVRFDLSQAHAYISEYQIGRCQVGWVAG